MPDASTMDPAILERVEKLWSLSMQGQAASIEDTYFLASTLRTALADTRRVDWMDKNQFDIELGPDIRTSIDAAMAATPRES